MAKLSTSTALESRPAPGIGGSDDTEHSVDLSASPAPDMPAGPSRGRRIWNRWLAIAEVIGTIQMMVILSLIYWLILPFMAIPFRIFSDPLKLKRPAHTNWREKKADESMSVLESMGSQF